jgi:hypothetical protein
MTHYTYQFPYIVADFNSYVSDLNFIMVDFLHIVLLNIMVKWCRSGLYCMYVACCLFRIVGVIFIAFYP